jgi:hypothetical protein
MAIQPQETRWQPDRRGTPESYPVDFGRGCRLHSELWFDGGLLTDLVLILEREEEEDEWVELVRVDCCHNQVHLHRFDFDESQVRRVLVDVTRPEDIQTGADLAEDLIYGHWENYLSR